MQGRLLPKYQGRYQAHPVGYWMDEFHPAAHAGLDCIEFILDFHEAEKNPLLRPGGVQEISEVVDRTGVGVRTICADYFMEAPLHHSDASIAESSSDVLRRLLQSGAEIGVTDVVIPCVDQSSLVTSAAARRLSAALREHIPAAEAAGINLSLETDLGPAPFAKLLAALASERVTVNYDTGNSAALGFDVDEEFAAYGRRISDIHIKDRKRGGGSVPLGTGDTDFDRAFAAIERVGYRGPLIMQAFRDDEGVRVFEQQLEWVKTRYLDTLWN